MVNSIRSLSKRARLTWGLVCIAMGCFPISVALGLVPTDGTDVMAPLWVIALVGFVLLIAGLMILLANYSRANDFLAGVLCLAFGAIGTWVSLFSSSDGFSGGLFFLSYDQNVILARWFFGLGALICLAISAYAFRRAARSSEGP